MRQNHQLEADNTLCFYTHSILGWNSQAFMISERSPKKKSSHRGTMVLERRREPRNKKVEMPSGGRSQKRWKIQEGPSGVWSWVLGEAQGSCPAAPWTSSTPWVPISLPWSTTPSLLPPPEISRTYKEGRGEPTEGTVSGMKNQNPVHSPIFSGMRTRQQQISRWNCEFC